MRDRDQEVGLNVQLAAAQFIAVALVHREDFRKLRRVLPAEFRFGEQGQGFKLAMGALNVVRLAQVGARAVGKASHVLELMTVPQ